MNYLTSEQNNPAENLKEIYNSAYCITLDELPDLKSYPIRGGDISESDVIAGDLNQDAVVDLADVVLLQKYLMRKTTLTATQGKAADYQKDDMVNITDLIALKRTILQSF